MKLAKMTLKGFRRFLNETTLKTSSKLTVLIGPNEAGKSSILKAMTLLEDDSEFSPQDRYRFAEDVEAELRATFYLDKEDHQAIGSSVPTRYILWKKDDGSLAHKLEPRLVRPKQHRKTFKRDLIRSLNHRCFADELDDDQYDLEGIQSKVSNFDDAKETYSSDELEFLVGLKGIFEDMRLEKGPKYLKQTAGLIERFVATESETHPHDEAISVIEERTPPFVLFAEKDREIEPMFNVELFEDENPKRAQEPCQALKNLCSISELDLARLKRDYQNNKYDRVTSQIRNANIKLRKIFEAAWSQSDVAIYLDWQPPNIHIMVQLRGHETEEYNLIDERSDGFRQYVALLAFIIKEDAQSPILLIDEAELRLHYDAQADLIQTFTERKLASQVIYTTHSAGCLPEDLGVGVKLIKPIETTRELGTSQIENNFWSNDTLGFSPILYGMGAQTLAFFPTRKAVVTEGQTEMLLVPTIFRQVSDADFNGFQIVPGLANSSKNRLNQFALQGSRVVYLLDNDGAGRAYKKTLQSCGVNDKHIHFVSGSCESVITVEDWIDDEVFEKAMVEYQNRYFASEISFEAGYFDGDGKAAKIKKYEQKFGVQLSKTTLAYLVLELAYDGPQSTIFCKRHERMLQKLRSDLTAALD